MDDLDILYQKEPSFHSCKDYLERNNGSLLEIALLIIGIDIYWYYQVTCSDDLSSKLVSKLVSIIIEYEVQIGSYTYTEFDNYNSDEHILDAFKNDRVKVTDVLESAYLCGREIHPPLMEAFIKLKEERKSRIENNPFREDSESNPELDSAIAENGKLTSELEALKKDKALSDSEKATLQAQLELSQNQALKPNNKVQTTLENMVLAMAKDKYGFGEEGVSNYSVSQSIEGALEREGLSTPKVQTIQTTLERIQSEKGTS